jgi:branched-chain amino acid aminotransferase
MSRYAYFEGKIVPIHKAKVSIMTHAFNYGTALFEGIRGFYNKGERTVCLFRLTDHLLRLQSNSKILKIELPCTVAELERLILKLAKKNGCEQDVYIRPIAYKSREGIGVKHSGQDELAIFLQTMIPHRSPTPLSVCVSSWRRLEDNAIPPGAKISGAYVNSYLASLEAQANGYDEAIMLSENGEVSEGTGMNLFLVRDDELVTPPETANILKGITRDTVMVLAKECLGTQVVERAVNRSELYSADELFFTGTGAGITPVVAVDRRIIGDGRAGRITSELRKLYARIVRGRDKRFLEWCTPVQ